MSEFIFQENKYALWNGTNIEVRRCVHNGVMRGLITPVEDLRDDRVQYSKACKEFIQSIEVGNTLSLPDFIQYVKDQYPYCCISETSASNAWWKVIKKAPVELVQEHRTIKNDPTPRIYRRTA